MVVVFSDEPTLRIVALFRAEGRIRGEKTTPLVSPLMRPFRLTQKLIFTPN
jgi:hypothetical protein